MSQADDMKNQPADKQKRSENLHVVFEDQDLLRKFKAQCKINGTSYKEVTEKLAAGYLSGEFKVHQD